MLDLRMIYPLYLYFIQISAKMSRFIQLWSSYLRAFYQDGKSLSTNVIPPNGRLNSVVVFLMKCLVTNPQSYDHDRNIPAVMRSISGCIYDNLNCGPTLKATIPGRAFCFFLGCHSCSGCESQNPWFFFFFFFQHLFHPAMAYCGPACAVPSCASAPAVGFGSAGARGLGWGLGYGLGFGRGLGYGYGAGALAETSGSLGTLAGVIPSCINQIPASEVTIQPPAVVVTLPGPILSASCEPVAVGGNTPCAPGGIGGIGGFGRYGGFYGGRLGYLGRRGSICNLPC